MSLLNKAFLHDREEAIQFILRYDLDAERVCKKFLFNELDSLAQYLGFDTTGLNDRDLAKKIIKAIKKD